MNDVAQYNFRQIFESMVAMATSEVWLAFDDGRKMWAQNEVVEAAMVVAALVLGSSSQHGIYKEREDQKKRAEKRLTEFIELSDEDQKRSDVMKRKKCCSFEVGKEEKQNKHRQK